MEKRRFLSILARVVAATDYAPFKFLYAGVDRAAAEFLRLRLRKVPGVLGVYLTGSILTNEHVHGAADLDFFVVAARAHDASRLADALRTATELFPFLDPFPTLVLDEVGEVDDPVLLYRWRAGQLLPLFERRDFVLNGSLPNVVTWLGEASLQVRRVVEAVREGHDDLYFWKRRLGALKLVVEVAAGSWKAPTDLGLEARASSLVGRQQGRERCLQVFVEGIVSLDGNLGQVGVRPPNVPGWGEFFGVPRLDDVTHASLAREGPWTVRLGGFQVALAAPRWREARLFSWRPLLMTGFAEEILVISRLERPEAPLWRWTLEQARRTLAAIPEQLDDPELIDSDWGLVQLIQGLVVLQALPLWPRWRPDVHAHAETHHPQHKLFLRHLAAYAEALEAGQGAVAAMRLPPNFFGYLRAFARAMLGLGAFPRSSFLIRKTKVSLCLTGLPKPLLEEVLASLEAQTRQPDEIVVVDDGEGRAVCEGRPSVRYFSEPGGAFRARALRESTGELLAFTREVPGSDWLAGVERHFMRDDRLGAATRPSDPLLPRAAAPREAFRRAALGVDGSFQPGWRVALSGPVPTGVPTLGWAWRLGQSVRRPRSFRLFLSWPGRRFQVLETRLLPPGVVCLHPFLLMHVLLLAWLVSDSALLGVLAAFSELLYLAPDLTRGPVAALRRYVVNVALTLSHFLGGVRSGCLYVSDVV